MVKVACYGEMHSTVDNFFAKVLFIFELACEILFLILVCLFVTEEILYGIMTISNQGT